MGPPELLDSSQEKAANIETGLPGPPVIQSIIGTNVVRRFMKFGEWVRIVLPVEGQRKTTEMQDATRAVASPLALRDASILP